MCVFDYVYSLQMLTIYIYIRLYKDLIQISSTNCILSLPLPVLLPQVGPSSLSSLLRHVLVTIVYGLLDS